MTVFYVCCVLEFGHSTDTLYDIVLPGQVYVGGVIMINTWLTLSAPFLSFGVANFSNRGCRVFQVGSLTTCRGSVVAERLCFVI